MQTWPPTQPHEKEGGAILTKTPRRSNRERAKERAPLHANMVLHRNNHATLTRDLMARDALRALAVPSDVVPRPSLHHPRSHIWLVPLRPCSEVERGVNCQLSAMEQREAIHDDFNATLIKLLWEGNVEVSNQNVRGNSSTSLTADSGCCALKCEASSPQHAHICARCGVMAKDVEWTATPAGTQSGGQREPSRRRRSTLKTWASKREVEGRRTTHEGQTSHGSSLGPQHGPVDDAESGSHPKSKQMTKQMTTN